MTEPPALAFEERQYSVPQLGALAGGLATALANRGVTAGARVALMSSNRPEFVAALRAIWWLGATAVLLSPAWRRDEAEHALALTNPAHAVGDHPVLAELMPMLHLDEPITPDERPTARLARTPTRCWFSAQEPRDCPRPSGTRTPRWAPQCCTGATRCS
ncbi:AMP-binding enzyme family protein [Mycobacterium xenopi 4042]|uniref:AMP-binding enzyme family protein n=1 Tax=Mycobacterium xenopi 4042 TaxID=1299334 RepID=X8AH71_MYCXE|nr:AMP-binding enzyme family protein [Mycobacterium xenopi 4042]